MAAFEGHEYTGIADPHRRYAPAYGPTRDARPTTGKGAKVYFWWQGPDGIDRLVECDMWSGARTVPEGDVERLVSGKITVMCPACGHGLHVSHDNKTVYVSRVQRIEYTDPDDGGQWMLPTLTILEPVFCEYREESAGTCRWAAKIASGRAYPVAQTIYGKGTPVEISSGAVPA